MPAPLDLSGHRFGKLVAIQRARERNSRTAWLCMCDCGTETLVPVSRLSSVSDNNPRAIRACERCRSRRCKVCGRPFLTPGSTATCGDETCRLTNRRAVNTEALARSEIREPGINRRRGQDYWARVKADPVRLTLKQEREREEARARRAATPISIKRAKARAEYAIYREAISEYRKRWKEEMTPKQREEFLKRGRASQQKRRARFAISKLMSTSRILLKIKDREDD